MPLTVPKISAAALAAAQLSLRHRIRQISIFGIRDFSIPAVLSLYNSFPELTIHHEISGRDEFHRLWQYDIALAPLHYQGAVAYIPSLDFISGEDPEMIIFSEVRPDWKSLQARITDKSILIFEGCQIPAELLESDKMQTISVYGINVMAPSEFLSDQDPGDWFPMNGNFLFRMVYKLNWSRKCARISIVSRLLARTGILDWLRILRIFLSIRKNG